MSKKSPNEARRGIWRVRRIRFSANVNVFVALCLAGGIALMVNYLAARHNKHFYLSTDNYYRLSDKTVRLMESLEAEVKVVAFLNPNSATSEGLKRLLREYVNVAAGLKDFDFQVEFVDPGRDVGRTRELATRYAVEESDTIVFECGPRRKYIKARDTVEKRREIDLENRQVLERTVAFHGESLLSSAMMSVAQDNRPVIYFLKGHGERGIDEYGSTSGGYSQLATILSRDNIEVKPLLLLDEGAVPEDASALVLAGPRRKLGQREIAALQRYLEKGGRLFVLLDAGTETGLEGLLESWGCRIGRNVTAVPQRTAFLPEGTLTVSAFADHVATRHLAGMAVQFYRPRPIEAITSETEMSAPDRPRVKVLAASGRECWIEADLEQMPPRFDEGEDRPGPVPLAVAIERGPENVTDMEIRPTRLVVIGDATLVSNGALSRGIGSNIDLFMGALNWLVERDKLVAIAPRPPNMLSLKMSDAQTNQAFIILVGGIPGGIAVLGFLVWLARRS